MHFGFIVNIILFAYLQKSPHTKEKYPHLEKTFKNGVTFSVILMILFFSIGYSRVFAIWISNLLNLALAYFASRREELTPIQPYVKAFLPVLAVDIVRDVLGWLHFDWLNPVKSVLHGAEGFALVWMIAMWVITRRQQNALVQKKLEVEQKELAAQKVEEENLELEKQVAARTAEITSQKEELQLTLNNLKETQTQLIQAEKMASLGELTAGIAHEIQNPLNFVNNFSEVSTELLDEMKEELENGSTEDAMDIINDLKANLEKIHFHGGRASSIVKGMLDHSRESTDEKVMTDINALCHEYVRLSYHGLRAKDKSFNASFETAFQDDLPPVRVVSQDLGRVLLNIMNNAFYAVDQRSKELGPGDYEPKVIISTHTAKKNLFITITDNGSGMTDEVKNKLFQPFFTTKPTGQGTGLGLSISYEIVTKGHGGDLIVQSAVDTGSKFIIKLPM